VLRCSVMLGDGSAGPGNGWGGLQDGVGAGGPVIVDFLVWRLEDGLGQWLLGGARWCRHQVAAARGGTQWLIGAQR
jgi:hypothetical protein